MSDKTIMNWSFYNPVAVRAGVDVFRDLKKWIPAGKTLLVTDAIFTKIGRAEMIAEMLGRDNLVLFDAGKSNPELDDIDKACRDFRDGDFSAVIAMGGGSVIDVAKVLSVMLDGEGGVTLDEIFRKGKKHDMNSRLFLAAIPTTAGTGSEVTPFATVWDSASGKKFSFASEVMFPSIALLDPSLTLSLPEDVTLYTALDAISHALESLWNRNTNPVSESFAMHSLKMVRGALPLVLKRPDDIMIRARMQWASMLAGLCISQTKTAIAHSISYPLTLKLNMPHGLSCGFTLGALIDVFLDTGPVDDGIRKLLLDIKELLDGLNLKKRVLEFGTLDTIVSLIPEMYSPERADNYFHEVNEKFMLGVIHNALG